MSIPTFELGVSRMSCRTPLRLDMLRRQKIKFVGLVARRTFFPGDQGRRRLEISALVSRQILHPSQVCTVNYILHQANNGKVNHLALIRHRPQAVLHCFVERRFHRARAIHITL